MKKKVLEYYSDLFSRFSFPDNLRGTLLKAFNYIKLSISSGGKLLVCGNGGSASDADHFVGELMKGFNKKRNLPPLLVSKFIDIGKERGEELGKCLDTPIPAISLVSQNALITSISNDMAFDYIFAQQILGYGKKEDVLFAITTTANSKNIQNALITSKAIGIKTICLTGTNYNRNIEALCDVIIEVPGRKVSDIQELHLPIYHTLSAMLEEEFFGDE